MMFSFSTLRRLAVAITAIMLSALPAFGAVGTLELVNPAQIECGQPFTFAIRASFTDSAGSHVNGTSNGFRIYSPDGATWTPIVGEWDPSIDWASIFDYAMYVNLFGVDGTSDDTIGFAAIAMFGPGLSDGFDSSFVLIHTQVSCSDIGKTICIDSTWYPPSNTWVWSTPSGEVTPDWGGPYCLTIIENNQDSVCYADGDVNGDGMALTVSDLVYLAAFVEGSGPAPDSLWWGDMNGDGMIDSADIEIYQLYFAFGIGVFPQYPVPTYCDMEAGVITVEVGESLQGEIVTFEVPNIDSTDELGQVFVNPSFVFPVTLRTVTPAFWKDPGSEWDSTLDVDISIWSVEDSTFLPDTVIFSTTLSGSDIAAQSTVSDSIVSPILYIFDERIVIGPAKRWAVVYSPSNPAHVLKATLGADPDVVCNRGSGQIGGTENVYQFRSDVGTMVCHVRGNPGIGEIPVSTAFQYWNRFLKGVPLSQDITITLGTKTHASMNSGVDLVIDQVVNSISLPVSWFTPAVPYILNWDFTSALDEGVHTLGVYLDGKLRLSFCFWVEDCPLITDAPWAVTTVTPNISSKKWEVEALTTPLMIERSFTAFRKSYTNKIGLDGILSHDIPMLGTTNSTIGVTKDNLIAIVMNKSVLNIDLPSTVTETSPHPDAGFREIDWELWNWHRDWNPTKLNGHFSIPVNIAGLVALNVKGDWYAKGYAEAEASLHAPDPYGGVEARAQIKAGGSASVELKVLIAKGKVSAGADLLGQLKVGLLVPSGTPQLYYDHCFKLDGFYSAGYKFRWGKWHTKTWSGNIFTLGNCPLWPPANNESVSVWLHYDSDSVWYDRPSLARSTDGQSATAAMVVREIDFDEEIYVSSLTDSGWSTPSPVTTDGVPKLSVSLAANDSGFAAIYVVSDPSTATDSVPMQEFVAYLNTYEIVVATQQTGGSWNTVSLTNDNKADGDPQIAGYGDDLYAVWVHNTGFDAGDLSAQRINYSVYDGAAWSAIAEIPGQIGCNGEPQVSVDASTGEAVVVWTQDVDADLNTSGDRYIKIGRISSTGQMVGTVETVPTTLGPISPSLAVADTGDVLVVAYECANILYDDSGQVYDTASFGELSRVGVSLYDSVWTVYNIDSSVLGSDPKVVVKDDKAYMVYRKFDATETTPNDGEISYMSFDLVGGTSWSYPVQLTDDAIYTDMGDITFDANGNLRVMYMIDTVTTAIFPAGYGTIYETVVDLSGSSCNLRGDFNHDGNRDIADLTFYVSYLFGGGPASVSFEEGDVNNDGTQDIADLTFYVAYMFAGGATPPECGVKSADLSENSGDVNIIYSVGDGYTEIWLESNSPLKGIEIELSAGTAVVPVSLVDVGIDLLYGHKDGLLKVGLVDLEGELELKPGKQLILRFEEELELVNVVVANHKHQSFNPPIQRVSKHALPRAYALHQNYPNPFNPSTEIGFALPRASDVKLTVFNLLGQLVVNLVDERLAAGNHIVTWDGGSVASGIYFYRLETDQFTATRKMLLLK